MKAKIKKTTALLLAVLTMMSNLFLGNSLVHAEELVHNDMTEKTVVVSFHVIDDFSENKLLDVSIEIKSEDGQIVWQGMSNEKQTSLPLGAYTIKYSRSGYEAQEESIILSQNEDGSIQNHTSSIRMVSRYFSTFKLGVRWEGHKEDEAYVQVRSLKNDKNRQTATLNEANNWTHTFELPSTVDGVNQQFEREQLTADGKAISGSFKVENRLYTYDVEYVGGAMIYVNKFEREVEEKPDTPELVGSYLQVLDMDGNVLDQWVTTDEKHTMSLKPGDYILREIDAPTGFQLAEDIHFSVDNKGVLRVNGVVSDGEVVMYDYPGELKTTVSIDENRADENDELEFYPATNKTVVDTVEYLNLFKGSEYTLTGTLMKIEDQRATPISTVSKKFTASEEGNGVETIEFTNINLEENEKYVVFEKVESTNDFKFDDGKQGKHIVKHENINDKAQTILITQEAPVLPEKPNGKLKTTVGIDGNQATEANALTLELASDKATKDVVDTVVYENLVAGETYTMTGRLMKVDEKGQTEQVGQDVSVEFVAKETKDDNANERVITITFKDVEVEAGVKYVVFENAESKNEIAFKDKTEKHTVSHEDVNDKAQTVVVTKVEPEKPEKPEEPEEPKKPEEPKTPEHKTEEPDKKPLPKTGINPKTGDFFNYSLYAGLLALSGGSLLLLSRKYKKEEE